MLCPALVCAGNGKEWRPVRMHWTMTRVILRSFICRHRESFDDNDVSNSIAKPPKEPRQKQHNRNPKNYVCIRMPALLNVKYRRCTSPAKKYSEISRGRKRASSSVFLFHWTRVDGKRLTRMKHPQGRPIVPTSALQSLLWCGFRLASAVYTSWTATRSR